MNTKPCGNKIPFLEFFKQTFAGNSIIRHYRCPVCGHTSEVKSDKSEVVSSGSFDCTGTISTKPATKTRDFLIVAVSSNVNAFGLTGIILLSRDGHAFEVSINNSLSPRYAVGQTVTLVEHEGTGLYQFDFVDQNTFRSFECPRVLPSPPPHVLKKCFPDENKVLTPQQP